MQTKQQSIERKHGNNGLLVKHDQVRLNQRNLTQARVLNCGQHFICAAVCVGKYGLLSIMATMENHR